jgi:PTS system trehalose-specific IIC component
MIYINRTNEVEKQVSIPAAISCYLGVTEPAMFGINLKYGFPFLAAMLGSLTAAIVSVGSNVMANSIGVGGIPGILSIQPKYMLIFAVAMAIAIVVPFVLTLVFAKTKMRNVTYSKKGLKNISGL